MKKLSLLVLFLFAAFLLVGCGVSESYADKVNEAAEKDEHLTYKEVIDDLGVGTIDLTVLESGAVVWVKGCDDLEEAEQKYEDGKKLEALTVTFVGGKATKASWDEWTPEK